jgi:hypothetical protein
MIPDQLQKHEKRCPEKRNVTQRLKNERKGASTGGRPVSPTPSSSSREAGVGQHVNQTSVQSERSQKRKATPSGAERSDPKRFNASNGSGNEGVTARSNETALDMSEWGAFMSPYSEDAMPFELTPPSGS